MQTMNCEKAERLFDDFIAGTLAARASASLVSHLDTCTACRLQLEAARRLEKLCVDLQTVRAPDLRPRVVDGIRSPNSSRSLEEKHMKSRSIKIGLGLATALGTVALAASLALTPRSAMALVKKSIRAVQHVATAKVSMTWTDEKGHHFRTVWSDHDRTRDEADGRLSIYAHGKSSDDPDHGLFIGRIDPGDWTLDHQLDIFNGGLAPIDLGLTTVNGRPVRLVRIERTTFHGVPQRWDYYLDDDSKLPVRFINYANTDGRWEETWAASYEFNVPLSDSLFDLPVGKSWHVLPNQDEKPAEVID
jgi:hypothetical protein